MTKANLKTLFSADDLDMETRITEKNIFCARKGAQACLHPVNRKLFTFGGVGTNAIGEIEVFDEETLELTKLTKY